MIDLHCDTLYALDKDPKRGDLGSNTLSVDLGKMERGGVKACCFAMFVHLEQGTDPWEKACRLHDLFLAQMEGHRQRIRQVSDGQELEGDDRLGAFLTCEEGQIIEGDLSRLSVLADWQVRLFTLTWNFENDLAYPNSSDPLTMGKGLKDLGIEAIGELERLHILLDVSHLNDGGFRDVALHAKRPFVASHSDSRECTPSQRNLTDEMLGTIADHGGVVGLNFCPSFLSADGKGVSRIADMTRHADHIRKVAGSEVLALGTDFDGISGDLEIPDCSRMGMLWDGLKAAGFSERELDMIWYENAMRVLSA
jgi:membrane dipeptidase